MKLASQRIVEVLEDHGIETKGFPKELNCPAV